MIYLYFLYIIMSEKNRGLISVLVSYVNRLKKTNNSYAMKLMTSRKYVQKPYKKL